ncbi:hypothetical protein [Pseudorhodoferax sp. Leaf267]|uniref:hypothetical protein n=1 Tax=Pseudorhodoferax sp. Leaf267 TaxID=1736316 RepID=UPI0012E13D19|nr:hypothetical protein [Pseudorhodoferax sp. Leaf267]
MESKETSWFERIWMCVAVLIAVIAVLAIVPGYNTIARWLDHINAPAWVQAVGSIVAIAATGAVVAWQHDLENRRAKKAQDEEIRRILKLQGAVFLEAHFTLKKVAIERRDAVFTGTSLGTAFAAGRLRLYAQALDRLPVDQLPHAETLAVVLDGRTHLGQALHVLDAELSSGVVMHGPADGSLPSAARAAEVIGNALNEAAAHPNYQFFGMEREWSRALIEIVK